MTHRMDNSDGIILAAEDYHPEQVVGWKNLSDLIELKMNNIKEK